MKKISFYNKNYLLTDKVNKGFTSLYGLSEKNSNKLFKMLGIKKNINFSRLDKDMLLWESLLLLESIPNKMNTKLKTYLDKKNQKLIKIKSYRGLRKKQGFPVRGQRTRTNSKTSKKIK